MPHKKSFASLQKLLVPCWITFSDPHVHNVWLIMDNWENMVLWSGSTKGWCNRFRKQCRWFAVKYFFVLRIKTLITQKFFGATELGGGIAPIAPPVTRLVSRILNKQEKWKSAFSRSAASRHRLSDTVAKRTGHSWWYQLKWLFKWSYLNIL